MMYRSYQMGRARLGGLLTPGVKGLLIANGIVYLAQIFIGPELVYLFGLTPAAIWKEFPIWQPVTYMFLHGGFTHLLFNMFALWMFGSVLESVWGTKPFLRYYFITGVGAGLSNCFLTPGMRIPIIGASGAVYGLLAAYALLFPNSLVYIYGLFPIKAKWLAIIFGMLEFISSVRPGTGPVAHLVHLGGMIIGVLYLRRASIVRWVARRAKRWQKEQNLRRERKQTETEDKLRREVDDLLDKINEVGLDNLTNWERRRLREASKRLRLMEEEER